MKNLPHVAAKNVKTVKAQPVAASEKGKTTGKKIEAARVGKIKFAKSKTTAANKKLAPAKSKVEVSAAAKKTESTKPKAKVATKKIKSAKSESVGEIRKPKSATAKISAAKNAAAKESARVSVKKSKSGKRAVETSVAAKAKKIETARASKNKVQNTKISAPVKTKNRKSKIETAPQKIRAVRSKRVAPPIEKPKRGVNLKPRAAQAIENKIEAAPVAPKPKKRKAKAIGSAVFRGRKERYDFQVFPLDSVFDQMAATPAIYVISKRKTDRDRRAHHALLCIGQTDSIAGEIKRHQKNCIKKHAANVISILPESSETKRLKIEADLKAAHSTVCSFNV